MSRPVEQELQPHQISGALFLAERPFALLADQAGAGKTATAIAACDLVGAKRVAVFCPAAVRPHWGRQFEQWQRVVRPVETAAQIPSSAPKNGVTIMSHAVLSSANALQYLTAEPYDVVVVDEGGEFRNFDAARTRHLYGVPPNVLATDVYAQSVWQRSRQTWHLSATPITNTAADLYPLFHGPLSQRTSLGRIDWYDFAQRFTELKTGGANGEVKPSGIRNAGELRQILAPWLLRREVELGVPLSLEQVPLPVPAGDVTRVLGLLENWSAPRIEMLLESGVEPQDGEISRVRRALGITMAPHVIGFVRDMLEQNRGPLVVFFHHQDVKNLLYNGLSESYKVAWIDGKVTRKQLIAAETWFQAGRLDVLLVQTQAGGMGITLTRSNFAIMAELPWTAAAAWQAFKRIHRMGQTRECWGAVMTCDCWLMQIMLAVLARKKSMSEQLLDPLTEKVQSNLLR